MCVGGPGGGGMGQCHQMSQGGGKGLAKLAREFFFNFFYCFSFILSENKNVTFHPDGGGTEYGHQMYHGGGRRSKIGPKSVKNYYNGPN